MENLHLLVAGLIYLLGLVCFLGYVGQKTSWHRGESIQKIKQRVFYMIWVWGLVCAGIVNWGEGLPFEFMVIWAIIFFFASWFIKEAIFKIVHAIRRCRYFRRYRR